MKVATFCWKAILSRIPTKLNLVHRGVVDIGYNVLCPFCNYVPKSTLHLLMSCNLSHYVWMHIYNWMGLVVVLPIDLREHFSQHAGLVTNSISKKHWRLLWFSTIWSMWLQRNDIVFKGARLDFEFLI